MIEYMTNASSLVRSFSVTCPFVVRFVRFVFVGNFCIGLHVVDVVIQLVWMISTKMKTDMRDINDFITSNKLQYHERALKKIF